MNKRRTGAFFEEAACVYLQKHGVIVLERNFRCRQGEIDIIGRQGDCVIFFEVKYRRTIHFGEALCAVPFAKQKKICQCAQVYCMYHPEVTHLRYDVIGITDTKISWVKNAFLHVGYTWN